MKIFFLRVRQLKKTIIRKLGFNGGNTISNENQVLVKFIQELSLVILVTGFILFIIIIAFGLMSILKEDNYDWSKYSEDKNDNIVSMINQILKQTNNFYIDNRKQTFIIFICSIVSFFIVFITLIISIFIIRKNIIAISSGMLNIITGSLIWIYKKCYN